MRFERAVNRWIGVSLTLLAVVATIWLTATDKLTLYIHPRYIIFTATMAAVAGVLLTAATVVLPRLPSDQHHRHDDIDSDHSHPTARNRVRTWSRAAVLLCAGLALLVAPPSTLSSTVRQNRALVTPGQGLNAANTPALAGGNTATFSIRDWATVLSQGGPEAVLGKKVDLSGYVLDQGGDDVFFVARLMVSCCAVDAQPVGLAVRLPGWRNQLQPSAWIAIKGTFVENPDQASDQPTVIKVGTLTKINEPRQPYVF